MPISSLLNAPIMPSLHPTASPNTNHYRPSAYYDTRAPSPQSSRIHSNSGPDIQDNTTSSISSTEAVVQIKCSYQVLVRPQVRSSAPPKTKAQAESYTTILALQTLTRSEFMNACLTEHHKHEDYNLATPNGPPFSIHWTGSTGGRAGRIPVKDDRQYKLAIDQISRCNTSKANFRVIVEFDLEEMKGWESRKRHHADSASTEEDGVELSSKAPRLTDFSHDEQLVGHYIIKIQEKWPCTEHKGEHGEAGTCWKDANNQHVGINNRVKKSWAETIAAGTHTIAEPPNINGIETTRNGVPSVHPRGRGPRPSSVRTIAQPEASGATIQAALLATATATLARLARSRSHSPSRHRSHHRSHSHRRSRSHYRSRSHRRHRLLTPPSSPLKAPDPEIQNIKACLQSYFDLESIDWRDFKSAFNDKSYSPDLIPAIELSEIMNLTGCNEGTALRFRLFCTKWVDRKKKEILRRGQ
ncbi:hypothetical protein D9757_005212 [Collybiopsis confluens]|uniref:Uncharacterized protein n=1 Tax=Collybiopsis confluens TaxID=2823264 RepID=A0A8H5HVZ4_9AGAR|nr:hypothetical protein D9757_005212 [Collybiopsis confluens]